VVFQNSPDARSVEASNNKAENPRCGECCPAIGVFASGQFSLHRCRQGWRGPETSGRDPLPDSQSHPNYNLRQSITILLNSDPRSICATRIPNLTERPQDNGFRHSFQATLRGPCSFVDPAKKAPALPYQRDSTRDYTQTLQLLEQYPVLD
jgi:hypothetical protein